MTQLAWKLDGALGCWAGSISITWVGRQDYKIGAVCGGRFLWEGGECMEEVKVRKYG
jgi:hypothetical protein